MRRLVPNSRVLLSRGASGAVNLLKEEKEDTDVISREPISNVEPLSRKTRLEKKRETGNESSISRGYFLSFPTLTRQAHDGASFLIPCLAVTL